MTWSVFEQLWRRYDEWYDRHPALYQSELRAVEEAVGDAESIIEVGVGTGRFAAPLATGRRMVAGVDPAVNMLRLAKERGVDVAAAVGEKLPVRSGAFDAALVIVTLCFADDPYSLIAEAARVARRVVSCIVPRGSSWGRLYSSRRDSPFYRVARFYAVGEVGEMYRAAGLRVEGCTSTLYTPPPGPPIPEEPRRECSEEAGFTCIIGVHGDTGGV